MLKRSAVLLCAAGLTVSVDAARGDYVVTSKMPAWKFAGTVGAPLTGVHITPGRDKIGTYKEIAFQWTAVRPLSGAIREYDSRPLVGFAITTPQASDTPPPDFPSFQTFPPEAAHNELPGSRAQPLGRSGIAFFGDSGLIIGTGQPRIPSLQDGPNGLTAQVAFAPGEDSVLLRGYAAKRPTVAVSGGSALPLFYDAAMVFSPWSSRLPGSLPRRRPWARTRFRW